jgi:hypothetical protein
MLSRSSVFFLTITAFSVVGKPFSVEAFKHSQIVSPEFQRRAQTLDEVTNNDMLDEDHLDEDHLDADHIDEDHIDEEYHREDKPWGEVIVASILINLASLVGLFFLVGSFAAEKYLKPGVAREKEPRKWNFTDNMIPSFACGALLATAIFLIIPESYNLISAYVEEDLAGEDDEHDAHRMLEEDDHEDHVDTDVPVAWRFGVSIIGGFLLPIVTSMIFPQKLEPESCELECEREEVAAPKLVDVELRKELTEASTSNKSEVVTDARRAEDSMTLQEPCENAGCDLCQYDEEAEMEPQVTVEGAEAPSKLTINYSLASSILLGDFFHNFTDGIFIGTAFMLCTHDLAIAISAATIYHELAQELADYFLLTKHCNLRPAMALTLNFVSGLSVLFGGLLILSVDMNSNTTGCLLAVGAGVYLHIAAVECLPRALSAQENTKDKLVSLISFVCGVIPIGLVLMTHGHCEVSH